MTPATTPVIPPAVVAIIAYRILASAGASTSTDLAAQTAQTAVADLQRAGWCVVPSRPHRKALR